jgi:hypothetical protein
MVCEGKKRRAKRRGAETSRRMRACLRGGKLEFETANGKRHLPRAEKDCN